MPHENIASSDPQLRTRVSWRSDPDGDGHVQIATLRAPQITYTSVNQDSGWYADLNREQINRLIRMLRRARDAAFGADA